MIVPYPIQDIQLSPMRTLSLFYDGAPSKDESVPSPQILCHRSYIAPILYIFLSWFPFRILSSTTISVDSICHTGSLLPINRKTDYYYNRENSIFNMNNFEQVIELDSGDARYFYNRGYTCGSLGAYRETV